MFTPIVIIMGFSIVLVIATIIFLDRRKMHQDIFEQQKQILDFGKLSAIEILRDYLREIYNDLRGEENERVLVMQRYLHLANEIPYIKQTGFYWLTAPTDPLHYKRTVVFHYHRTQNDLLSDKDNVAMQR